VSPLRAANLSGVAPAVVVTAGFDPLRDEGEAYAVALQKAGNHVTSWREPGLIHGYLNYAGVSRESRDAVKRIATEFRALVR
jgi:acetyl esterase